MKNRLLRFSKAIHSVLERTPPELMADISQRGIVLTGGSLLYGLDRMLSAKIGVDAVVADDAVSCVAIGTGKALRGNKKGVPDGPVCCYE